MRLISSSFMVSLSKCVKDAFGIRYVMFPLRDLTIGGVMQLCKVSAEIRPGRVREAV